MSIKIFAIEGHADSDFGAIRLCADKLRDEGLVKDEFCANCIEREKNFPTGLPSALPVAMPHSEASGVVDDGICVLRLDEPVNFRRMDDPDVTIDAEMVFNLAVTDPKRHLKVLQNLMGLFMDEEKIEKIQTCDLGDVPAVLGGYLASADA